MDLRIIKDLLIIVLFLSTNSVKAQATDAEIDAAIAQLKSDSMLSVNVASNTLYQMDEVVLPKLQQTLTALNQQFTDILIEVSGRQDKTLTPSDRTKLNLIGRQQQNIANIMTELCSASNADPLIATSKRIPSNAYTQTTLFTALSCIGSNNKVRLFVETLLNNADSGEREKAEALNYLGRNPKLPGDIQFAINLIKPTEHLIVRSSAAFLAGRTGQTQLKASIYAVLSTDGNIDYKVAAMYGLAFLEDAGAYSEAVANFALQAKDKENFLLFHAFIHGDNTLKSQRVDTMLGSGSYVLKIIAMEYLLQQADAITQLEQHQILKSASQRAAIQQRIAQGTQTLHFSRAIFNNSYFMILKMFGYTISGNAITPTIQKEQWNGN